jgi:hypothetical protein
LIEQGKTLNEIAVIRDRRFSTIVSMASHLVERGLVEFQDGWVEQGRQREIEAAVADHGLERITPDKEALRQDFAFDEIRLVVASLSRRASGGQSKPRQLDLIVQDAESGARGRERSGASFAQFQSDHFQIAHHPVNDEPRNDVKAAHAHQHGNVANMRDHGSGNNSRK